MMHRYDKFAAGIFTYEGKKAKNRFISDFCEVLQTTKKSVAVGQGAREKYEWLVKRQFFVGTEFWKFEVLVRKDSFIVQLCLLNFQQKSGKMAEVRYFCHYDGQGRLDNELRNITEFREFLNREVLKEEAA